MGSRHYEVKAERMEMKVDETFTAEGGDTWKGKESFPAKDRI